MTEDINSLFETLRKYNDAYRSGTPLVSDHTYDRLVEQLRERDPGHPYLRTVEPEEFAARKEVRHPAPMLSIEKAYTKDDLHRFITRVQKAADNIGIKNISFRVTPKLDGIAGRDDGNVFVSRGNGTVGYEITSAFQKGVVPVGGRGLGLGEIVIVKSYFNQHLSDNFEHPRNMVVGIVSSDTVNEFAVKALQAGVVRFVPYVKLPYWEGSGDDLSQSVEQITADIVSQTDYPLDGMVAAVTHEDVINYMGATSHHYRWQIAIKTRGETAVTNVENIVWQVGRTGNVTPVLEVGPVSLSGATIKRVTAHHAGLVREKRIGIGSEIEIIRSGEVIPKLEKVITESAAIIIPSECPVCSSTLFWAKDFLKCGNRSCSAQLEQGISHWFKTLGNADWFGIKTIQKLVENGYDSLEKVYALKEKDFFTMGFGPVQSKNLEDAIHTSKTKSVEDWRFLAAFGIPDLGTGDSRKLLSFYRLEDLSNADAEDIRKIDGFGKITSKSITQGIASIKDTIHNMLSIGFNIETTPLAEEQDAMANPISGKSIVFTGKMQHGSREEMQAGARRLGANVHTSVSGKTDFLVCGENVGTKKIEKAEKSGTTILSEARYLEMMQNTG